MFEIIFLLTFSAGLGALLINSSKNDELDENILTPTKDTPEESMSAQEQSSYLLDLLEDTAGADMSHDISSDDVQTVETSDSLEGMLTSARNCIVSDKSLVVGSNESDLIYANGHGQVIYHNKTVIESVLQYPQTEHFYQSYQDDSPDTIFASDGDDSIFLGTGDEVDAGKGSDILHVFLDMSEKSTVINNFESGKDKVIIYVNGRTADLVEVHEKFHDNTYALSIENSEGFFTIDFPAVSNTLETDIINEEFDPETNPLVFIGREGAISSDVYVFAKAGHI